jgi:ferritin-like metal-binding protein YciE
MSVDSLHDKFVYHLEEMYYVETELVDLLDVMAEDVVNDDLAHALDRHRDQTEVHVERVEDAFDAVDARPEKRPSPTFDALVEERDSFFDSAGGDEDMGDLHNLGIAAKNEHMEIAGYENLIMLARKLDLPRAAKNPLSENLDEEEQTKKQLKAMADDSTVRKLFARLAG